MVAYSFKRRFVAPIKRGLVSAYPDCDGIHPKRQTIRADRKRHARPDELVQLYYGMRTKTCFLIGMAICLDVELIKLHFHRSGEKRVLHDDFVHVRGHSHIAGAKRLDEFARSDGFDDWNALRQFWDDEHDHCRDFTGVIIFWEPTCG